MIKTLALIMLSAGQAAAFGVGPHLGKLFLDNGSESSPSVCFADDQNTGFYSTTDGYVNGVSDGQDNLRFGAGTVIFYNASGNAFSTFNGSGDNTIVPAGSARFEYGDGTVVAGRRFNIEGQAADPYTLSVSSPDGTMLAYIGQNGLIKGTSAYVDGNLGVGTASPGQKLTVDKAGGASDTVSVANAFMYIKDSTLDSGLAIQSKLSSPYAQTISGFDSANNPVPLLLNPNGGNVTIGAGGTPLNKISTGTETGTSTNLSNLDAATFITLDHYRIGNIVHVFGEVDIDPSAAGAASFRMNLPVASNFTVQEDCGGGFSGTVDFGRIYGNAASDQCVFEFSATDGTNRGFNFWADYKVK